MPITPPVGPGSPQGANGPAPQPPESEKAFQAQPMTFLTMHFNSAEATKLWQVIIESVNREIQKDKDKAVAALRKFREDNDKD